MTATVPPKAVMVKSDAAIANRLLRIIIFGLLDRPARRRRRWRRSMPPGPAHPERALERSWDGLFQNLSTIRFASNRAGGCGKTVRSEEHTSELQSLMRISYAVFLLKKKKTTLH